jgi:PAS domain S-box-containing protein
MPSVEAREARLREANLALQESEERFRLIADSAPVPMWVTKLDRKRSFVNRAYIDFLGISYEEAVDFDWREILHPDDHDRVIAESIAGEASLGTFDLEARYRCARGEWCWIRSTSQPRFGPNGDHLGFIGVAHDITASKEAEAKLREMNEELERRVAERTADLSAAVERLEAEIAERLRAEELLRQAQKMEAVGQLTGGIAHDFNNLLTPIVGGLQILLPKMEDERMRRIAGAALESAQRGARLTGQLLAFSRVQRLEMVPVPVNGLIDNMRELVRQAIGDRISLHIDLDPEAGSARCDANQLENGILNLAINARDAMPDGGTLTIATARETLEAGPDMEAGDYVRVRIADTGSGMEPDVLARAAEPFFTTKPVGRGTGLGLAQVYGIARQSGGTLRIASTPGEGTSVDILLPAVSTGAVAHPAPPALPEEPVRRSTGTILVIDDDASVRSFLVDTLESFGHRAVEAESGAEALGVLEGAAPDLVLLDYAMPGMHGADVARALRRTRPELPILFVTGYAETGQIEAVMGADFHVLRKPFSTGDLDAVVTAMLASNLPPGSPSRPS